MLNLDTHILIHALNGSLTPSEKKLLAEDSWSISAIVLWEIAKLRQLQRIELDIESVEFLRALAQIRIWPLDLDVCLQATRMDFQGDPADEIIAATSVVNRLPLVTRDRAIRKSRLVQIARLT